MSNFNPEQFEQQVIEGENQTSFIPVPEGDYSAFIEDYEFQIINLSSGQESLKLNITWSIPDDALAEELGVEELQVRQQLWLDRNEDGSLAMGTNKNVQLGRLREALGMQQELHWPELRGKPATVSVTHQVDKNDSSIVYANVNRVTAK